MTATDRESVEHQCNNVAEAETRVSIAEARADAAERNARRNWERAGQYWDLVLAKDRQLDRHREVLGRLLAADVIDHTEGCIAHAFGRDRCNCVLGEARTLLSSERPQPAGEPPHVVNGPPCIEHKYATFGVLVVCISCGKAWKPESQHDWIAEVIPDLLRTAVESVRAAEPSSDGVQAASEPDWLRDVFSRFVLPGLQTDCGRVWYPNVWQSVDEAYRDWLHNVPAAFKLVAAGIDKGTPAVERAAPGNPESEGAG